MSGRLDPGRGAVPRPSGRTIWKFVLPLQASVILMPVDAQVVAAGEQDGQLVVWALCSRDAPTHHRRFVALNTGDDLVTDGRYVGTVTVQPSGTVWHLFEESV